MDLNQEYAPARRLLEERGGWQSKARPKNRAQPSLRTNGLGTSRNEKQLDAQFRTGIEIRFSEPTCTNAFYQSKPKPQDDTFGEVRQSGGAFHSNYPLPQSTSIVR